MKNINLLLLLLSFTCCLVQCNCNKNVEDLGDGTCTRACRNGHICLDSVCVCPEGTIEIDGTCTTVPTGAYYGASDALRCYESLILSISHTGNIGTFTVISGRTSANDVYNGYYHEYPNGDSIRFDFPSQGLDCTEVTSNNVYNMYPKLSGLLTPDKNLIYVRLDWYSTFDGNYVKTTGLNLVRNQ